MQLSYNLRMVMQQEPYMLDVKKILTIYFELWDKLFKKPKSFNDASEYFARFNNNKDDIRKFLTLKEAILSIMEYKLDVFTADDDTYTLTRKFLVSFLKQVDKALEKHTILLFSDKNMTLQERVEVRLSYDRLLKLKKTYQEKLDSIDKELPTA